MGPPNQPPVWLSLLLLLLLSSSGRAAPLAQRFVPIDNTEQPGTDGPVTIGRCAANERLLHVENLMIVKSQTTTLTGALEIHIDPRFAVSCVRALPKTLASRAALKGYRFPRPSCIEIHVQEEEQKAPSLDFQLLVYGVRRRVGAGRRAAAAEMPGTMPV